MSTKTRLVLHHVQVTTGHLSICFPDKNRPRWVATIKRVKKITDASGRPYVAALHLGQTQLAVLDHVDQPAYSRIYLGHESSWFRFSLSARLDLRDPLRPLTMVRPGPDVRVRVAAGPMPRNPLTVMAPT